MKKFKKLEKTRLKKALIINIFAEIEGKVKLIKDENLLIIPYLINSSNKNKLFIDIKMLEAIKEYTNEK